MTPLTRWLASGLLLLAAVGASGCRAGGSAQPHPSADLFVEPNAAVVSMQMEDVRFSAPRIEAQSGSLIELAFVNSGAVPHDFTIRKIDVDRSVQRESAVPAGHSHADELAVHVALAAKQEARLRLHLHERGTYEYYCSEPGHSAAGMKGTLVVS